jgi:hypothetical protein
MAKHKKGAAIFTLVICVVLGILIFTIIDTAIIENVGNYNRTYYQSRYSVKEIKKQIEQAKKQIAEAVKGTGGFIEKYAVGDKGPPVPLMLQGQPSPWAGYWPSGLAGGTNIASSGCGYTSMAMAITYLTQTEVTPQKLLEDGAGKYHTAASGIGHDAFMNVPAWYGCKVKSIGHDINALTAELQDGKVAVASNIPGKEPDRFSTGGHIICIRGITEEGCFLVNNPNGRGVMQLNLEYSPDKFDRYVGPIWVMWKE